MVHSPSPEQDSAVISGLDSGTDRTGRVVGSHQWSKCLQPLTGTEGSLTRSVRMEYWSVT